MVVLEKISREELLPLIELAFLGDELLLQYFHISPGALHHCVQHTHSLIDPYYDNEDFKDHLQAYALKIIDSKTGMTGDAIGYTVVSRVPDAIPQLYSFGININHRNKSTIGQWIQQLTEILGPCYFTQLWDCNTRAINFFERNNFITTQKEGYKILLRCQQED